jgi:hypothetical protein
MSTDQRNLRDLVSIGPAMLRDFELLGIASVEQLSRRNPEKLYEKLCQIMGSQWTSAAWMFFGPR